MFVILVGWLIYAVAWFLPVVEGGVTLPKGLPGWEALQAALHPEAGPWYGKFLSILSGASNLVAVASPLALRRSHTGRRIFPVILAFAFLVNAQWCASSDRGDLRIGYFLWWSSFLVLAIGFALYRREEAT